MEVKELATTIRLQKLGGHAGLHKTVEEEGDQGQKIINLDTDYNQKPAKRQLLMVYKGPTLQEVVYWLNKKSINLYAEQLLKLLAVESGKEGSTEEGVKVVEKYLREKGLDLDGFRMADGSGLSRLNGISPRHLAEILRITATGDEKVFSAFENSLPVAGLAGDPGSISYMCRGTKAASNLKAKSGYIFGVRCYAGYVKTRSGKLLCFSMMANNFTCSAGSMRNKLEKLMVAMAELE